MKDYDNCQIHQWFGGNAVSFYNSVGLKGHTGVDSACGYGSDIHSPLDGQVYSIWSPETPHPSDGYTSVYILSKTKIEVAEWSFGHVSEILVDIGDQVKKGDLIAREGNKGTVYSGGVKITLEMQKNGDKRGAHRHIQKRPVKMTRTTTLGKRYLQDQKGLYRDGSGFYYEVYDNGNGFAGCIDWTRPLFDRNLVIGMRGYDVYLLQKALNYEYFMNVEPTGFFGPKTFSALIRYQNAHGISPIGICGPKTRDQLNKDYKQL